VPLSWDGKRGDLIETQQRIYRIQKQALNRRLEQQLEKLDSYFQFQQHRLSRQLDDTSFVLLKMEKARQENAYVIQNLEGDPARNIDNYGIELIDARYAALDTRLKIYEILLKIMATTQARELSSLFEFD